MDLFLQSLLDEFYITPSHALQVRALHLCPVPSLTITSGVSVLPVRLVIRYEYAAVGPHDVCDF